MLVDSESVLRSVRMVVKKGGEMAYMLGSVITSVKN